MNCKGQQRAQHTTTNSVAHFTEVKLKLLSQEYSDKLLKPRQSFQITLYLLTAIGLTPGGSSTVHIYIQTIHRTTQLTTLVGRLSGI